MHGLASLLLGTILFYVSAVSVWSQQESPEQQLVRLEKQWAAAGVKGDSGFFNRIAASDYVIVDASGEVRNKRRELALAQHEKFETSTVDDLSVRVYGNSAVVLGRYSLTGTNAGQPYSERGRFTDVWIHDRGKWLLTSSQNTSLPAPVSTKPPADQFFIEKEKEDWDALKRKDKVAASRLLADDFVGMYDGGLINKSEWLKQIDDQYGVDDYTITEARVLHPSQTTALLLYTATCKGTGAWAEFCSSPIRISDLWVERNGEWVALFSQDTMAGGGESDDAAVLKEILTREYGLVGALARDDIEGFAKFLPEDVIDIDEDGIHTKAELIPEYQEQKDRGFLFREFRFDDPKLIRLGPDQATMMAKETARGFDKGKPFELRTYLNATYVRRDGKWVPRVYQDTDAASDEPDDAVMKEIVANEQKIFDILKRNDIVAFGNMLPDDLIDVEDDGIHTKSEWLKEFEAQKKTGLLFTDFKMEDLRLVRYSPSAATLVFRETIDGLQGGKPFEEHINSSSGYVNRGGKWVPVLYQDTAAK